MSSTISPATRNVLNRLRNFKPPYQPTAGADCAWSAIPWQRRASVLVLLFESRTPNSTVTLSTVLTRRGANLSSFSGQVALPGGKADTAEESVYDVARREAFEEIGLPLDDPTIEYVATLPTYLSRNMLAVQPTVAYISSPPGTAPENLPATFHSDSMPSVLEPIRQQLKEINSANPDETAEVAEVFSVTLNELLYKNSSTGTNKDWHKYKPVHWGSLRWPLHDFSVIRENKQLGEPSFFSVWGLTARILVDVARISFSQEPDFNHEQPLGDEELLAALLEAGYMGPVRRKEDLAISFQKVFGKDSPLLKGRL